MIVYHGTSFRDAEKIRKGIDPRINFTDKKELDFGYGFYMADRKRYAKKTALAKTSSGSAIDNKAVVLTFELDLESIVRECGKDLLCFRYKSLSFLRTVFTARLKRAGIDTLKKRFIVGPIADGNVDEVMDWYLDNPSLFRKIISFFRYWLPVSSRQYVLKDKELCKFVVLINEEVISSDK